MSNPLGNSSNLVVLQRLFILKSFWIDICMQRLLEDPTINSPSHLPICFSTQHKKAFEDSPEWCTVFTMISLSCLPQREQQGWYFLAQKHLMSIAFPLNAMQFFLVFAAKWASVFLFLIFYLAEYVTYLYKKGNLWWVIGRLAQSKGLRQSSLERPVKPCGQRPGKDSSMLTEHLIMIPQHKQSSET